MRVLDWDEIIATDSESFASGEMCIFTRVGKSYVITSIESYSDNVICLDINDGYMCNYYTILKENYKEDEIVIDVANL